MTQISLEQPLTATSVFLSGSALQTANLQPGSVDVQADNPMRAMAGLAATRLARAGHSTDDDRRRLRLRCST
jgi:hypothetical protein